MIAPFVKAGALLTGVLVLGVPLRSPELKPKPVKVTGCLQNGDEADEFVMTDKAGKKYELTSKSVKLAEHVGHTVTVKGSPVPEEKEEKEAKGENEKQEERAEAKEYAGGHVVVSSLVMVSPKCR